MSSWLLVVAGASYYLFLYCSPLMASKLKEMDDVVRTMHLRAIMDRSDDKEQTLLVSFFFVLDSPFGFRMSELSYLGFIYR